LAVFTRGRPVGTACPTVELGGLLNSVSAVVDSEETLSILTILLLGESDSERLSVDLFSFTTEAGVPSRDRIDGLVAGVNELLDAIGTGASADVRTSNEGQYL
jgi:hypothetical protein